MLWTLSQRDYYINGCVRYLAAIVTKIVPLLDDSYGIVRQLQRSLEVTARGLTLHHEVHQAIIGISLLVKTPTLDCEHSIQGAQDILTLWNGVDVGELLLLFEQLHYVVEIFGSAMLLR